MKNELYSLTKIFTERILRVPDYQRGYIWTTKQLKDFWSDLCQLQEGKNHYTGVLTLEEANSRALELWAEDRWIIASKGYTPLYVVDGQQRLTTAIILIQVITENIPEGERINYTSVEEIRKKFIFESKDGGLAGSYLFGYEKDNPSHEYLKTHVFQEDPEASYGLKETIYTSNLEFAKAFFTECVQSLPQEEIQSLYRKLTQHFLFNIYSISSDFDVFVSFETMNNRGMPLSHLELLKNRLIYLSTLFDDMHERELLRRTINDAWKAVYFHLGKNKDNPLDDDTFLYNHFVIECGLELDEDQKKLYFANSFGYSSSSKNSFYQSYLLDEKFSTKNIQLSAESKMKLRPSDIARYVNSLKRSVETWYQLQNPEQSVYSPEEKQWIQRFHRLGFDVIAPLLLVLFQNGQKKIRSQFLALLERNYFLSVFFGTSLKSREDNYNYCAGRIRDAENLSTLLTELQAEYQNSIPFGKDALPILSLEFQSNGFYRWEGIRYFLFEYEMSLQKASKTERSKVDWKNFEEQATSDYITIEHIFPQKPTESCWNTAFAAYKDEERRILANSLGNLLALSRSKNSSLSNACFEKKTDRNETVGYRYGSYSENEVTANEDWTAQEILDRGLKMLRFLEKRWDFPIEDAHKLTMLGFTTYMLRIGELKLPKSMLPAIGPG